MDITEKIDEFIYLYDKQSDDLQDITDIVLTYGML